jgi:hypothetical protein
MTRAPAGGLRGALAGPTLVAWAAFAVAAPVAAPAGLTTAPSPSGTTNGPLAYETVSGQIDTALLGAPDQQSGCPAGAGAAAPTSTASPAPSTAAGGAPSAFPLDGATPAWSPSGLRLAFSRPDARGRPQIFVLDTDGTAAMNIRMITHDPKGAIEPTWAPDGQMLAYTSLRGPVDQIWTRSITGRAPRQLTDDPGGATEPDWSPTLTGATSPAAAAPTEEIAFVSRRTGNADIWLMNVDGSDQRPLTSSPANEVEPDWRTDGRALAFSADTGGGSPAGIFKISSDGSVRTQLTARAGDAFPSWSPAGDAIAFTRTVGGVASTWVGYSVGGSGAPLLTTRKAIGGAVHADWGPLPPPPPTGSGVLGVMTAAVTPVAASQATVTTPLCARQTSLTAEGARVPLGTVVDAAQGVTVMTKSVQAVVTGKFALVTPARAALTPSAGPPAPAALTVSPAGPPLVCPGTSTTAAVRRKASSRRKPPDRRSVMVSHRRGGPGKVRVIGHDANGSSERTIWDTVETCRGTTITVRAGLVSVYDKGLGRTFPVAAGHRYFARRVGP